MTTGGDNSSGQGSWAYVLVTGDAIVAARLPWVLERLRAHGLVPRVAAVLPFGEEEICALYGASRDEQFFVAHPGGEDIFFSLQMHGDLYGFVPTCLVTLHHPGEEAIEALIRSKGTTQPEGSPDGTIRQGGENVIFNLVHAPDSEADARAELTRLLGAEITERLAEDARGNLGEHPSGVDSVDLRLPTFYGPAATSTPVIVNKLRARIVQRLVLEGAADNAELLRLTRLLETETRALLQLESPRERLLQAQRANGRLDEALAEALRPSGESPLMAGAEELTELLELEGERSLKGVQALRKTVFLSPLEWVFLRSHSYGFRPNETLRPIYGTA